MRRLSCTVVLVVTSFALTSPLHSQLIERKGSRLWLALGAGGGSVDIDCPVRCPSRRGTGVAGFFQVGGTPSPRVPVGIEFNGWRRDETGVQREYFLVTAFFDFYPVERGPLFLHGGFGAGRYVQETATEQLSAAGFGFQFGGGYEFRVSPHFLAAPYVRFLVALGQNAKANRFALSTDLNLNMIQLGGQVRWLP